jgi:hypothetical protein
VNPQLVQRQAGLAAAALLATLGALALGSRGGDTTAAPPPSVVVRWETAAVGVLPPSELATWSCSTARDSGAIGIGHPTLPCGVDLVVAHNGTEVRTEVIARTPVATDGPEFWLTKALAEVLGMKREGRIQWRFAQ